MTNKIETIQLQLQVRNARKRGPTSSDQINDTNEELAADLTELTSQWNNRLVPLTTSLPNGSPDTNVDAFVNGLDGDNLYVDQGATASVNSIYFNIPNSRPNTVLEQLDSIYTSINSIRDDLENQISNTSVTALQVSIADGGGLYSANNVEDALAEVMTAVNIGFNLDLSKVAQHYLPILDDSYDLGSSSKRIRDLYLGPASLNILATLADGEAPSDKNFTFSVESVGGKLQIKDGVTVVAEFDSAAGAVFPAGNVHDLGGSDHNADTLANLNTKVSDATLIDTVDSRLSDDRTASGIRTATTVVGVSSAAAPSIGQVLKATSSTVATWQNEVVPGGTDTNIQFNNSGVFGGNAAWTVDTATQVLISGNTRDGTTGFKASNSSVSTGAAAAFYAMSDSAYIEVTAYSSIFNTGTVAGEALAGAIRVSDASSIPASKFMLGTTGSAPLHLFTNDTKAMTIDSSQNVAIPGQIFQGSITTYTPSGTTQTIDWDNGNVQTLDLESASGNVTLTLSNPEIGATYILKIIQDSAVDRDVVWPASVLWQGGTVPVISTTNDGFDIITLLWDGTNYFANAGMDYQ